MYSTLDGRYERTCFRVTMKLSRNEARRFMLKHLHLNPPRSLSGKKGVLEFIKAVGCIQFDPLDRAGQNPDLVLQSRVKGYRTEYLQQLLYTDRKLVDGWERNMCIYPVEDWPFFSRTRKTYLKRNINNDHISEVLPHVRDKLKEEGPLSSLEFSLEKKIAWPWGPARIARAALESMFWWGELIVHHRTGTRKYYDFSKNHLPQDLLEAPDPNETLEDYHDWHVKRRIRSVGLLWALSGDVWLGIRNMKGKERAASIARLLNKREICEINVEGLSAPLYMCKEAESILNEALVQAHTSVGAAVIAPLDNLLWNRRLVKELFNFDYIWEVYKPPSQRRYGYYVVPILLGDKFIARFEPVRSLKGKTLVVEGWWWEEGVSFGEDVAVLLEECLREFMAYLGVERVILRTDSKTADTLKWICRIT